MTKKHILAFAGSCLLLLTAACEEQVAVDAPLRVNSTVDANYNYDEAQCRAEAKRVGQGHIGKSAAVGGVIGAAGGAIESSDNALIAGVLGAAAGAAVGDYQVKQAQRDYLIQCMRQRGHAVSN